MSSNIENCRKEIDTIDSEILKLFNRRMEISGEIGKYKEENNLPITNIEREKEILLKAVKKIDGKFSTSARILFSTLMELSKSYQRRNRKKNMDFANSLEEALKNTPPAFPQHARVACCGVPGAYAQLAADRLFQLTDIMYFNDFAGVFQAVEKNLCEYGVLPVENSTSGTINQVYDLMLDHKFYIVRSIRLRVRHCLLAAPGVKLGDIKEVVSHEQGLKQCSVYLGKNLPKAKLSTAASTAMAAKMVAESGRKDIAAIASTECGDIYNLSPLEDNLQNREANYTRFICISRKPEIYPGADKISIMGLLPHRPGSLYSLLARFSVLGVNLTKLESRPRRGEDFEYMFYFDFASSVADPEVRLLLSELFEEKFTFLGNYSEQ